MVKNLSVMQETQVLSLDWEDLLKKGTAIHSSILAWRFPWTEEPDGLQSMGCRIYRTILLSVSQVVLVVKNTSTRAGNARDAGSIPGSGRCPGGRHGSPLQ